MKKVNLAGRDLISVADLSAAELACILDHAAKLKQEHKEGKLHKPLQGKGVALIFQKPSTRTRLSFEMGVYLLGGHAVVLNPSEMQLGRGETIEDTGKVLSRYLQAIMIRTFAQEDVERLAAGASVPVINGLTDLEHPCQVLADLLTIRERKGQLAGLKLTYLGDGNNVANSLLLGCALAGMDVSIACPAEARPDPAILKTARRFALGMSKVEVTSDPAKAVHGARVLYTDVWVSMGQEETPGYKESMRPYQINRELLAKAEPDAMVLHCLPAHRGEEITGEVMDGEQSAVWDQAENRMYAQMALLDLLTK
jgi:ornithine carbamoyltransferase